MLLYVCERCKFTSPKSALCQTCGAQLKKEMPAREVIYRLQETNTQAFWSSALEVFEQMCERWREAGEKAMHAKDAVNAAKVNSMQKSKLQADRPAHLH